MALPGPCSYVLLLGAIFCSSVFFQDDFNSEKPACANVAFDRTKQEAEQLLMGAPTSSLYGAACQICHNIFGLDFPKRRQEKLYAIGIVLLFIVIGLLILCLLLRHIKNIKPRQAMTETPAASEAKNKSTQNNTKMLELLVKNTCMINTYMKYIIHHKRKELKSKLRTRRKIYEVESDASLPVCFCYDSCQDSA